MAAKDTPAQKAAKQKLKEWRAHQKTIDPRRAAKAAKKYNDFLKARKFI